MTPPFSGSFQPDDVPPGHQLADHRFLLSLLATSIFLSIPSVAAQTLSLILKTIGPTTIRHYLSFACGTSLVVVHPKPADVQPAVGLESIATQIEDHVESILHQQFTKGFEVIEGSLSALDSEESRPEECIQPSCHYGKISDKIGEACACWLTRWAIDILQLENELKDRGDDNVECGVNSEDAIPQKSDNQLLLWRRGGLTPKWISAIISADTLFVKNEMERYNLARTVVELRRSDGIIADEESIWNDMFEHGIHYANMVRFLC